MARKPLWTKEQLEEMASEIKTRRNENNRFSVKDYAKEKGFVYGTLYQALRRIGLFESSRRRRATATEVAPAEQVPASV